MADLIGFGTAAAAGSARAPRGAVRLNGLTIDGWESWSVENNALRAADSFAVTFAVGALPSGFTPDWFAAQSTIMAEILASAAPPAGPYQPLPGDRLILGQVDDIAFDPVRGSLTLTGRDLTARLIDTHFSVGYLNQTASMIATTIAAEHGLTPVVADTFTPIGNFYSQNHINLTQQRSAWDILTDLAEMEVFDVYVLGDELHFEPPSDPAQAPRYVLGWQAGQGAPAANVTSLRLERSLTLARGVSVTVQSWHARRGQRFAATWPELADNAEAEAPLAYNFIEAGLTQDQCQQLAQARYQDIARHTLGLTAELPGDDILDCRMVIAVSGTGTAWDQDYFPDAVRRTLSVTDGYRMTLSAKNIAS